MNSIKYTKEFAQQDGKGLLSDIEYLENAMPMFYTYEGELKAMKRLYAYLMGGEYVMTHEEIEEYKEYTRVYENLMKDND